jgi:hypothetical protein
MNDSRHEREKLIDQRARVDDQHRPPPKPDRLLEPPVENGYQIAQCSRRQGSPSVGLVFEREVNQSYKSQVCKRRPDWGICISGGYTPGVFRNRTFPLRFQLLPYQIMIS